MAERLTEFVLAADEVGRLQRGDDPECRFFQSFCELGHYGGRTQPSNTRQGIYAVARSGRFLASINHHHADRVAKMLDDALAAWGRLSREERLLAEDPVERGRGNRRFESRFPKGGIAMRVTTRDLARDETRRRDDWGRSWNEDQAWFRPEEIAATFGPAASARAGAAWDAPPEVVRRIARCHLVDNVRGQTLPFRPEEIERAALRVIHERTKDGVARVRLEGNSRASAAGRWSVGGRSPEAGEQTRGFEATWFGYAEWDVKAGALKSFELVVTGTRWGGTRYNVRHEDLDPAPMGCVIRLISVPPESLVAPAHVWSYGW